MRSQASMPNLASSRPNDLSCSRSRRASVSSPSAVGRHDRHPAVAEPGSARHRGFRRSSEPDRNRTLHRRRQNADLLELVKPPAEAH